MVFAAVVDKYHHAVCTDVSLLYEVVKKGCQSGYRVFQHLFFVIAGGYGG